ncbi:MAG: hypothetical protein AAFY70_03435 [Bacteroidota bacterium]
MKGYLIQGAIVTGMLFLVFLGLQAYWSYKDSMNPELAEQPQVV